MKTRWVVKNKSTGSYLSYLDLKPHKQYVETNLEWTPERSEALRFKHLSSAFAARELTHAIAAAVCRLR